VLVRDPHGKRPLRAFFSTDVAQTAPSIIADFVHRWPLEVTFEEARTHLGLETQRQWNDSAIERTTPALLGLFSLIVLLAHALYPAGVLPLAHVAWYPKTHATFTTSWRSCRGACGSNIFFRQTPQHRICVLSAQNSSKPCFLHSVTYSSLKSGQDLRIE